MCTVSACGAQSGLPAIAVSSRQRRRFIKGLAGLPLATVLALPELCRAAAARTAEVSIQRSGGVRVNAALALPMAQRAPTVLLIHEWWGLNAQIKAVAADLAQRGYAVLAVDLYGKPAVTDADSARAMMNAVDPAAATDTLVHWVDWLRRHPRGNGKVATIGWCFGGGWSLNAALAAAVDGCVIYYGNVARDADELRPLRGPVLGHFATRDGWINAEMVGRFAREMAAAGHGARLSVHWYEADHAFANPSSARFDEPSAALSWRRTHEFLRANLF